MLGNFSFGDYFKAEVIPWTWEFLVQRLGLHPDRLCATVYLDDDEAFAIWRDVVGLPEDRIHRLGEDKNYWPANAISQGPNGPCGPCTEVFYRVASLEEMTTSPGLTATERYKIDDAAGRWLEIWNNVFTQYNRSEDEHGRPVLEPLPAKNNDTGAGFDRIVMVLQGKRSVFETDLFQPTLSRIEELAGRRYGGTMEPADFAFRVVAEHTRAMAFCIADGILPGNEGREYVLRRIMRRAIRFGKTALGVDEPFIHRVAPCVIEQMGGFYPELVERRDLILSTILQEEERFLRTLDRGLRQLTVLIDRIAAPGSGRIPIKDHAPAATPSADDLAAPDSRPVLPGEDAFTLYDTYGFPLELTEEIAAERGVRVDLEGFGRAMEAQRERSRESSEMGRDVFKSRGGALAELQRTQEPTQFVGCTTTAAEAKIAAILRGQELVLSARAGDEVELVLDRTPFYAEAGGQVGDTGRIQGLPGDTTCALKAEVLDTQKAGGIWLHRARILEGEAQVGDSVRAVVDADRRRSIMRNHTATHLLHAALRSLLGPHVHQKGSLVAPDRLRFDFTHTAPLSDSQLAEVEALVNARILDDVPVAIEPEVPLAEAKARGAMALFGEKYGERVRVVEIPGFSVELCGGTHLQRTSQAGLFKIIAETGVAAGVRRIEAVTGAGAYAWVREQEETLARIARALRTNPRDVLPALERLQAERTELERKVRDLSVRLASGVAAGTSSASAQADAVQSVDGIPVLMRGVSGLDSDALAALADQLARSQGSVVVVLGSASDDRVQFVAKVTPDLVRRGVHAGRLLREVARIAGGGGGGRPDFAQAGGRDTSRLAEALAAVPEVVRRMTTDPRPSTDSG